MKTWTVANQKGGVAKTTTSVALGGLFAQRGERTLLLDIDPHGSLSSYFRCDPDSQTASTFTLFEKRKLLSNSLVRDLFVKTAFEFLTIIPASTALATLERQSIGPDGMGLVLAKSLSLVEHEFDRVIIDCPPQLGVLMVNALAACDQLIVPVQTEFLALQGLDRLLRTLAMLQKSRKKNLNYTVVPTMFDRRTQASVTSLRRLRNDYQCVWPGKIPIDTKFRDASKAGVPPHLYPGAARGAEAYASLLHYLIDVESEKSVVGGASG